MLHRNIKKKSICCEIIVVFIIKLFYQIIYKEQKIYKVTADAISGEAKKSSNNLLLNL